VQGVVWAHAAFHKGKAVEEGGRPTLLGPAERVFAEVRRWVEGQRYERTEAKKAAGEGVLRGLEAGGKGLIAGRVALYPSSFECPAFMTKKLCL
jgi:hypothetical protein